MMQRVMRGTVDDVFQRVAGNHIGIMDLLQVNIKIDAAGAGKGSIPIYSKR